ncbi:MAG TPA: class I SAM-dependent methyltransferase family protein [Candidatus Thermoplasmatota archaeon]|nr:class I SAM-dependent methyltransferase family protein [Candidatus Thermoplasmatota archaeon]
MTNPRPLPPPDEVRRRLEGRLPPGQLQLVPRTYVRLGDILVLDIPEELEPSQVLVAETYAQVLRMRTVLKRVGSIEGELRLPRMRRIWGDPNTETIHVENGIRYRFDPTRVMFSPGNLPERQRVAGLPVADETVVDLFAGIGYFTLPLAVHGRPRQIIACEKNPVAFRYLEENIELNGVGDIVQARLGDNRDTAPIGEADRVFMGYLPDPTPFLPVALSCLKPAGGSIHYHSVVDLPAFPKAAFDKMQEVLAALNWTATLKQSVTVKSFGPGAVHGVLDVEVRARGS